VRFFTAPAPYYVGWPGAAWWSGAATTLQATDATYSGGFIGLRTQVTAAHFDYVVVYGNP
jgi:hypothetical protein